MPSTKRTPIIAVAALAGGALAVAVLLWGDDVAPQGGDAPAVDLVSLLADRAEGREAAPLGPWRPDFPGDHGPHPEAPSESWIVAVHLEGEAGEGLGIHLSVSRIGVAAPPGDPNPWTVTELLHAELVLTDGLTGTVHARAATGRGQGAAGSDDRARNVWVDDIALSVEVDDAGTALEVVAHAAGAPLRLTLRPVRSPVTTGEDGGGPLRAYAVPRLFAMASWNGRDYVGSSWLDHAWGRLPPPGGPLIRERLLVQLDNGTDLALLRTARRDGRGSANVEAFGSSQTGEAMEIDVQNIVRDEADGVWRIEAPGLRLDAAPLVDGRPAIGPLGSAVQALRVTGEIDGGRVSGFGTWQGQVAEEGEG